MWLTRWVVNHARTTVMITVIITIIFGYFAKNLQHDPDITAAIPKDIPAKQLYDRMSTIFPSRDFVLIAVESDSLFSVKVLQAIYQLTQALQDLPNVYSVMSPTNLKVIHGTPEGLDIRDALPYPPQNMADVAAFQKRLFTSDMPVELIISKDQRMAGIMVFLKNVVRPEEGAQEIMTFVNNQTLPFKVYITGKPVLTYYLGRGMARDFGVLFSLVILLILIILFLSFRNLRGVLIPLGVVIFSVLVTLGFMTLVGAKLTHSTNMLPILLASIAVADGIHILNRYYERARMNGTPAATVLNVMKELNAPVAVTSITTAFGFLALNTSRVTSVGDLGRFTAFGVLVAMIFSLTFIPAILTLLPIPKKLKQKGNHPVRNRLAVQYANFLIGHRGLVGVGLILLLVVLAVGFTRIHTENNTIENFPQHHPARIAFEKVNQNFAGTTFLTAMVETDSAGGIKTPAVLNEMDSLETFLNQLPHVGSTLSLVDFIKRMNKALHGDSAQYFRIPPETVIIHSTEWVERNGKWVEIPVTDTIPGRVLVAQYLQLYEMSAKPEDLANLVNYNYQIARINAFLNTESSGALREVDQRTREYINRHITHSTIALTGSSELFLAINDLVVKGQFYSILASLVLVTIVTALAFRSLRIGLLNAIPLFFAMWFNFGFMGWANIPLNIVTMLTSSIAIGVGVDYAVHFIHRFQMDLKDFNFEESLRGTMVEAGIPITLNAITVGLGFAVMLFSVFMGVRHMALLISLAMFTTCFGAITILPILFLTVKPRFLKKLKK